MVGHRFLAIASSKAEDLLVVRIARLVLSGSEAVQAEADSRGCWDGIDLYDVMAEARLEDRIVVPGALVEGLVVEHIAAGLLAIQVVGQKVVDTGRSSLIVRPPV